MQNMQFEKSIAYRQKIQPKAEILLKKLLSFATKEIKDVLVIGAGSFPSFASLSAILSRSTHVTLLEPDKNQTDLFSTIVVNQNITIINCDSKTFLQSTTQAFDLIYFEHPETMTLPLILGLIGVKSLKRVASFRESFAYLSRVMKPQSIIIASCMSKHECAQLKNLLQFVLPFSIKTFVSKNFKDFFYGGPYSSGLVSTACASTPLINLKNKLPQQIEKAIRQSNILLGIFLFLGLLVYFFYSYQHPDPAHIFTRLLMIFLLGSQLYFHQPGKRGLLIKIFLFLLQIALYF